MPTRVKRPSILVKLSITAGLLGFQAYLGYHVVTGTFGMESQREMLSQIKVLEAREAQLGYGTSSFRGPIF